MKKKLPLKILEIIEPYLNKRNVLFKVINSEEYLLKLVDIDKNSDFYFTLEQFKSDNGLELLINYKPLSKNTTNNNRVWVKAEQFDDLLSGWLKLLDEYNNVKSIFDDPILEAFKDEYFLEFEIIDKEANIQPFSVNQILLLDSHLDYIESNIEEHQNEGNKNDIQQIKNDVNELRNELTKESKYYIIKKLSKIWARITKLGPKFIKEFLSESKKEVIKQGVKTLINIVKDNAHDILN